MNHEFRKKSLALRAMRNENGNTKRDNEAVVHNTVRSYGSDATGSYGGFCGSNKIISQMKTYS